MTQPFSDVLIWAAINTSSDCKFLHICLLHTGTCLMHSSGWPLGDCPACEIRRRSRTFCSSMKTLAAMAADMAAGSVNSMKATTSRGVFSRPGALLLLLRVFRRSTPFMPPLMVPYCWKVLNSFSWVTFWGRFFTKMLLTASSAPLHA